MDERAVEAALSLDAAWVGQLRAAWLHLIDLSTWGTCAARGSARRAACANACWRRASG